MRLLGIALTAVAVATFSAPVPGAAAADDTPTCMGKPATIVGSEYADTLYGTPGDDVAWLGGTALAGDSSGDVDVFHGEGGDDLVCQGGLGGIDVDGGSGDDEVHLDGLDPRVGPRSLARVRAVGGAGADTLVAPPHGSAVLEGGDGDDILVGSDRGDRLTGGDGADTITAGAGDDSVSEGPGSDEIDAGAGRDTVAYSQDIESIHGQDFFDFVAHPIVLDVAAGTAASGVDVDEVTGNECWVGTSMGDTMTGADGDDCLDGAFGAGEDTLTGGPGSDDLVVYAGTATGGSGADTVAARYPYAEPYDTRQDPIHTSITVKGGRGADDVYVDGYRVKADGGPGRDVFDLDAHHPGFEQGGWRIDVPHGLLTWPSARKFKVRAHFSAFEGYRGSVFDDTFLGSAGADVFSGGNGADRARGGPGNDVLRGGQGSPDVADGGRGHDRCAAERRVDCEAKA